MLYIVDEELCLYNLMGKYIDGESEEGFEILRYRNIKENMENYIACILK